VCPGVAQLQDALVDGQVAVGHDGDVEMLLHVGPAVLGVDPVQFVHSPGHLLGIRDQVAGHAVTYDLRRRAAREGYDRRSAGQGLREYQAEGLFPLQGH